VPAGIANKTLDVHFKEDECQIHDRLAAPNLSVLRKLVLSLSRQVDPKKILISKLKKLSADFRRKYLLEFF
jgi:hypothetical protein